MATPAPDHDSADQAMRHVVDPQTAFMELNDLVASSAPLDQVLARVAELARACVPGAEEISVTLVEDDGQARTAAFTDSMAAALDERQYAAGSGPCLDAAESGQTIRIDDTTVQTPYPELSQVAARQGVRSIVSVGMPVPQRLSGGLNVYVLDEVPLDDDAVQLLEVFSGYAAIALAHQSLSTSTLALSTNLLHVMQSRAVIERAKGVLMVQLACTPEEAFKHLSRRAQRSNRKVHDVAVEVTSEFRQTNR